MGKMHGSLKAGRECLEALAREGGAATSHRLYELTGRLNPNNLAADARAVLAAEFGYADPAAALITEELAPTAAGRKVFRYRLREDALAAVWRRILAVARDPERRAAPRPRQVPLIPFNA